MLRERAPDGYPHREPFFAHRFCRLLIKVCAAQEMGTEACWLLTVIAHTEDAKRYTAPVTFYNEQLEPLCGFGSRRRLISARQRAIDGGWLHYESGTKGKAGRYWVLVPPQFSQVPDGSTDEDPREFRCDSHRQAHGKRTESDTESVLKVTRKADGKRAPFIPIPNPDPDPSARAQPTDEQVEAIYEAYPRHVAKPASLKAIREALNKIGYAELLAAVQEFAAAKQATEKRYIPHCVTWMNGERWTDDRREWRAQSAERQIGPGVRHDPAASDNGRPVATEGFF